MEIKDFSKLALNEVSQKWRTETEARFSVLNDVKFPFPASKYWQSIREQIVFFTQLIYLICDYQSKEGELELEEIKYEEIKTNTRKDKAMKKIIGSNINKIKFQLTDMRVRSKDRVREIVMWEKLKNEQIAKEDFDINDVNKHQKKSYQKRWQLEKQIAELTNNTALFKNSKSNLDTLEKDNNV